MKFDKHEKATILAALRNWQEVTGPDGGCDPRETSPEHFPADIEPLDSDAIDDLCMRINFGE